MKIGKFSFGNKVRGVLRLKQRGLMTLAVLLIVTGIGVAIYATVGQGTAARIVPCGEPGSSLPSSCSLIRYAATTVKNQGPDGICWSMATTTAIESNLKITQGIDYEFSAKQLDYLFAYGAEDASGNYPAAYSFATPYAKYVAEELERPRELANGFNFYYTGFALGGANAQAKESTFFSLLKGRDAAVLQKYGYTSWNEYNLVQRSLDKYFGLDVERYRNLTLSKGEIMGQTPDYLVTAQRAVSGDKISVEEIKEAVRTTGAVVLSMVWPKSLTTDNDCYDTSSQVAMDRGDLCKSSSGTTTRHEVAIVGWADNKQYEIGEGENKVTGKGAFLVQNSKGKRSEYSYDDMINRKVVKDLNLSDAVKEKAQKNYETKNYAMEYLYVAYDGLENTNYGIIEEVRKNKYTGIYDSIADATRSSIKNSTTGEYKAVAHTYTTSGTEYIDAIGVGIGATRTNKDIEAKVYIDKTGTGSSYESVGTVKLCEVGKGCGRTTIDLAKQIEVSGTYKIRIQPTTASLENYALDTLKSRSRLYSMVYTAEDNGTATTETEVEYTVKHMRADLSGGYPSSLTETETLTGVAGTKVRPATRSYPGFKTPSRVEVTIKADGSTVVTYRYERIEYNVNVVVGTGIKGSSVTGGGSYKFGQTVTLSAEAEDGYENVTWSGDIMTTVSTTVAFEMPARSVWVNVYATKVGEEKAAYKVEHYKQTLGGVYNEAPDDVDNLEGGVDSEISPPPRSYIGFKVPDLQNGKIKADGSTVIKYYYERDEYRVSVNKGEGIDEITGQDRTYKFEERVILTATTLEGYKSEVIWSGEFSSGEFDMPARNVVMNVRADRIGEESEATAEYRVEHYKQNIDESYNSTPSEVETGSAEVGTSVMPGMKTYTGFSSVGSVQSVVVTEDGSAVVKYYYSRNSYTVSVTKGEGIATVSGAKDYKFEETVSLSATAMEGYGSVTWSGDYTSSSFTMPAKNVSMTVSATRGEEPGPVDPDPGPGPGPVDPDPDPDPKPDPDPQPDPKPTPTDPDPEPQPKPTPSETDPDDEPSDLEPGIKRPDTGMFTSQEAGAKIAEAVAVALIATGIVTGGYAMLWKKLHKVDF